MQVSNLNSDEFARDVVAVVVVVDAAPRALKGGPSERHHLLGVDREDSEWRRRTTKGTLLENFEVWASLQPVFSCLRLLPAQRACRVGFWI